MHLLITKCGVRSTRGAFQGAVKAVILALLAVFYSCTLIPVAQENRIGAAHGSLGDNHSEIRSRLYAQYQDWKTVEFRHGGLSKKGIDCSGFVYITFYKTFGVTLPRSVAQQAETGFGIRQQDLRSGDLVFFKTGLFTRHVGIYLGNQSFLHVSQKRGVSISNLNDAYWKKRYWQARRI
jgi:cell wall-associated NlpC family hydrolase